LRVNVGRVFHLDENRGSPPRDGKQHSSRNDCGPQVAVTNR
jgi:hypothetical protein